MGTDPKEGSEALTMFSFDDIVAEIDIKRAVAKSTSVQNSWMKLRDVAIELAGEETASEAWAIQGASWSIERVYIENYRGIGNDVPVDINFAPSPGITVVHGLNGAGKSSISDAIEIGLTGKIPNPSSGTAGKAALWEPVHLAQGSENARIELTLVSDSSRLRITCLLDSNGDVHEHRAKLTESGETKQIEFTRSWHDALASHQPVFAYASLERRVQLSKDLARFFEGLLALGGSFTALEEAIEERAAKSNAALDRWKSSRDEAMKLLESIDDEYHKVEKVNRLEPVNMPIPGEGLEKWIRDENLQQEGTLVPTLPGNSRAKIYNVALGVGQVISRFESDRKDSQQVLYGALELLHSEAIAHSIDSSRCPVCDAQNSEWLTILSRTVEQNQSMLKLRYDLEKELDTFDEVIVSLLDEVISIGGATKSEELVLKHSATARELSDKYRQARKNSLPTEHSVLGAATDFSAWLRTKDAQLLIDDAIERADSSRQWKVARKDAVSEFVKVWREHGVLAGESLGWADARKRIEDLRKSLRQRRSATLESRAGVRIERLLSDAGLKLTSISVLASKASMELTDGNGNTVELGMLSAGQRNAVLLAPLLASIDGGPFEFIVLDDPVHAFDELRIDRLADALAQIAATRRVIVLTHDERLKEYLLAKVLECDTRLVQRDATSGEVIVSGSDQLWSELLDDAGHMHDLAVDETGSTNDITNSLRRLCRLSIDSALRLFVLRNAAAFGRNSAGDLQVLDRKNTTIERLDLAKSLWGGDEFRNPVDLARVKLGTYLVDWNNAVHDNVPTVDFSREEIKCARRACKILVSVK